LILKALEIILHENVKTTKQEDDPMVPQDFTWFFALFHQEFRKGNLVAFEVLMTLAFAHFFGCYNPKQLADYLGIPPLYTTKSRWV
jgi:hypothetical protein